ncbi:unnamed protein product [Rhizophagus irregularis]|nr:unnamed protein product [Rhizophagus irregularis]CAB5335771.1 unnamed protein product [Rhizophagus irregularis]
MSAMYKWSTEELISFLKSKDLRLDDEDFQVLREKKIDGVIFPNLTEERLIEYGLKRGPAMMISIEVQKLPNHLSLSHGKINYFRLFPPSQWSLLDFSNWVSSCWPSTAEDTRKTNQFFFNTLYILRDDPAVSTEVLDVVTNLLTQKKKEKSQKNRLANRQNY